MLAKIGYEKTHIGTYRYNVREKPFKIAKEGVYESLASFKALPSLAELRKVGRKWNYLKKYEPVMDRIVFDIDCDDLAKAKDVAIALMQELGDYSPCINTFFSGSKGFHIEILTDELDIIDVNADKPSQSCIKYVNILNYFNAKYPEVDTSLKDAPTRVFRKHHAKHSKTGNYKVLVDVNAELDEILKFSKASKDMVEPKQDYLSIEEATALLDKFSKPIAKTKSNLTDKATALNNEPVTWDDAIASVEFAYDPKNWKAIDVNAVLADIYNELVFEHRHDKIKAIGGALNGYVETKDELRQLYDELDKNTDCGGSENAWGTFAWAWNYDGEPETLGVLVEHYKANKLNANNLNKLSSYFKGRALERAKDKFKELFAKYGNDWFAMLEKELFDYVDNTENVFKGIINSHSALMGYASRMLVVNGGAGTGKSEYVRTIEKLMPDFIDEGVSTAASVRREEKYKYNRKIVYLGDRGLAGDAQTAQEEIKMLYQVFGYLVSDKKFTRKLVGKNDEILKFDLISDGLCVIYTAPYTNLRSYKAGDQYTDRSTYITINPVSNPLALILQENKENKFYQIHKNYIKYIVANPLELYISDDCKEAILKSCNNDLRAYKYLFGLFNAYCQYLQIATPSIKDCTAFLKIFKVNADVSDVEKMVYEKIYNNLTALKDTEVEYKTNENGVPILSDMLTRAKGRKEKCFFTARQIKTYFKRDFHMNKNLKDIIDQVPDILNNLYNAGLLDRLEWQYKNQNVYYIPYNSAMD